MDRQKAKREAKREFWRQVLADWARSGMSKSEYARVHGLKISTLRWWSSHYPHWSRQSGAAEPDTATERRSDTDEAQAGTGQTQHFLTVGASEHGADAQAEPLRLTVGGTAVEVPPGFCEQTLERLLGVLERRA